MSSRALKVLAVFAVIVATGFLARPAGVGELTVAAQPEATVAADPTTAEPTAPPTPGSAPWTNDGSRLVVQPFDFDALALRGESVVLGDAYAAHAVSPDGRWLALVTQPADGPERLQVRPTDALDAPLVLDRPLLGQVDWIRFTPSDATPPAVAWVEHPTGPGQSSVHYAPLGDAPGWDAGLPLQFRIHGVQPLRAEGAAVGTEPVAVYGLVADPTAADVDGETDRPLRLVVLDASGIFVDVELPVAVPFSDLGTFEDESLYQEYRHGLAWDTARGRLYVAHADADIVTVVDLPTGEVLTTLAGSPSPSERLARVFGSAAAHAGGYHADGAGREVLLNPDGSRLVVAGYRQTADSNVAIVHEPLPLLVFDTASGQLMRRDEASQELPVAFSEDGSRMLTVTAWWAGERDSLVRMRDAATLDVIWEYQAGTTAEVTLTPGGNVVVQTWSGRSKSLRKLSGRTGHVSAESTGWGNASIYPEAGLLLEWPY